jgi:hypothetical protein
MTGTFGSDDGQPGDALDRAIDDALAAELRGGPGDLRARVLARLEEPVEDRPSRWSALLRPALLPAAGVALIVVGVAVSWWRVDRDLEWAGSGQPRKSVARTTQPQPTSGLKASKGPAPQVAAAEAGHPAQASTAVAQPATAERRPADVRGRVFAASLLAMDAMARPKGVAADTVVAPDEEPESFLPGAVGGELGDPIRPIPKPRPVAISPLVAPPIVVAPIVDAPPVSTLATPVSTLSTDNSSRGQTGPGKLGGVRP